VQLDDETLEIVAVAAAGAAGLALLLALALWFKLSRMMRAYSAMQGGRADDFVTVVNRQGAAVEKMSSDVDGLRDRVKAMNAEIADSLRHVAVVRYDAFPDATVDEAARCVAVGPLPEPAGTVCVVSAGTSDGPVAAEAAFVARVFGSSVSRVTDVGVAGIHRLLAAREQLDAADVLIVVAGMEGALPSAVGGLVGTPTIAVPTSVGYGASYGGLAALLAMLNSCAPGVVVCNIDNGFGAGVFAARVARRGQ
jgi:NCAIR mutase (PurE)-related protein